MEHTEMETTVAATRRRRAIYTAALAGGLVLGGIGIAAAQTDTTSPPTTTAPEGGTQTAPVPAPGSGPMGKHRLRAFGDGPGMMGKLGGRGMLHGEFVTRDPDGSGYRTILVQQGTVTDVSASSVTVKSEDGYTKTYTVDDNTLVNAGNEGIGDVKKDDQVNVQAVADGSGDPHAMHIVDETGVGAIRRYWNPNAKGDEGQSSTSTSASA